MAQQANQSHKSITVLIAVASFSTWLQYQQSPPLLPPLMKSVESNSSGLPVHIGRCIGRPEPDGVVIWTRSPHHR